MMVSFFESRAFLTVSAHCLSVVMMPPLNEITNPIHSARLQNGARLFKYMRFHPGLNVTSKSFAHCCYHVRFRCMVHVLIVWCSIVIYGTGAMLGANVDFASFSDKLNQLHF